MRSLLLTFPTIVGLAILWACTPEPRFDTPCAQAAHRFSECGATLPALEGATCGAMQKAIATCVINNAPTCEALAALYQRIDVCVAGLLDNDGGGTDEQTIDEVPSIANKPRDAGTDAQRPPTPSRPTDPIDASTGDASVVIDAGQPTPTWEGFTVSDAILSGASRQWATPVLNPGTYRFSITGTGDADLYVRIGSAATTALWDCRPFIDGSIETCPITLTSASKVYLMLRGIAATSSFTLEGSVGQ